VSDISVSDMGDMGEKMSTRARKASLALAMAAASMAVALPAFAQPYAIVLNSRDASISVIDKATFREVRRVDVGKEPHHLYPTPDGKTLIVANAMSNDLHLLDPGNATLQRRIRGIDDPYQIGFSPDRKWFVVNALRLDRIDIYAWNGEEKRLSARIPLPKTPSHQWFSADSRFVYVTLQDSDEVAAIEVETATVVWKLKVGSQPAGIIVTPDGTRLMVGIMGEDHVDVIDIATRRSIAKIRTGRGAHNFRGLGDGRHVVVSNRVENTVSIIDMSTLKVVGDIPVPGGPDCMELTADGRHLWVTSRFARSVAVVDMVERKVVHTIPVGRSPHGIFFQNRAPLL
jgi:YVTN family beta-propeller protein